MTTTRGEMIDHEVFSGQLARARRDKGKALEREELFELLIHHVAHSPHRLALPADWTTAQVTTKLRVVFTGDPLINDMLDVFEQRLQQHEQGRAGTRSNDVEDTVWI
jgi:hypothetical protein